MDGEISKTEKTNPQTQTAASTQDADRSASDYVQETLRNYRQVMELFEEGEGKVQLKKRFMLKMLDEEWVKIIEDTIPSLDVITRNPRRLLQEDEELRPIEQTRRVTPRSIQHLSQHTDLINEIRRDGTVMPSKLLNVFQDETILTYENRFINTLLNRLYAFVCVRVDAAEECGVDEKLSTLSFDRSFTDGEKQGKISLQIQVSETPRENEVVKNHVYTSDLWKRALRLRRLVSSYMSSEFVQQMGKNYVRPPVMRTNMLLKNVDFRQCLTLWEFLESYENVGYQALIQEDLESVSDECAKDFYQTLAQQYVLFQKHVNNSFEPENALDSRTADEAVPYTLESELDPIDERDFTYTDKLPDKTPENIDELIALQEKCDLAVRVAVAADAIVFEKKRRERKPLFRYRYSFLARLILAGNPTQDFYTEIKNCLLSYQKVKSRVSWNHELFTAGRKKCARLNVKGKTVYVYLPINPDAGDNKYRLTDLSDTASSKDFPCLLRVKSARGAKRAKELIDAVMATLEIAKLPEPQYVDYHLPHATREEMVARSPQLVKIVGGDDVPTTDLPVEEAQKSVQGGVADEGKHGIAVADVGNEIKYRYRYSFLARLIQSDEDLQSFYGELKNYILSYHKVKCSPAWGHENFRYGRKTLLQIKIRGKSAVLYFALSPSEYAGTKYRIKDLSAEGKTPALPVMFKVKSARAVKNAKHLIDDVMNNFGAQKGELPSVDYSQKYMSTEDLLNLSKPLVKAVVQDKKQSVGEKSGALLTTERTEE